MRGGPQFHDVGRGVRLLLVRIRVWSCLPPNSTLGIPKGFAQIQNTVRSAQTMKLFIIVRERYHRPVELQVV